MELLSSVVDNSLSHFDNFKEAIVVLELRYTYRKCLAPLELFRLSESSLIKLYTRAYCIYSYLLRILA